MHSLHVATILTLTIWTLSVTQAYAISNGGHLDDQLYGLTKSMTQLGLQPTKRMHSLGMEAALRTNNLEVGHP